MGQVIRESVRLRGTNLLVEGNSLHPAGPGGLLSLNDNGLGDRKKRPVHVAASSESIARPARTIG